MSRIENVLRGADEDAAELGHAIVWTSIGDRAAKGLCSGCGRDVEIESSEDGLRAFMGLALRESCTHDYAMKKPSLQRSTESSSERLPAAAQS